MHGRGAIHLAEVVVWLVRPWPDVRRINAISVNAMDIMARITFGTERNVQTSTQSKSFCDIVIALCHSPVGLCEDPNENFLRLKNYSLEAGLNNFLKIGKLGGFLFRFSSLSGGIPYENAFRCLKGCSETPFLIAGHAPLMHRQASGTGMYRISKLVYKKTEVYCNAIHVRLGCSHTTSEIS
jgi:hypothetical protein